MDAAEWWKELKWRMGCYAGFSDWSKATSGLQQGGSEDRVLEKCWEVLAAVWWDAKPWDDQKCAVKQALAGLPEVWLTRLLGSIWWPPDGAGAETRECAV